MLERLLGTWDLAMRHVAVDLPVLGRQVWTPVLDDRFVHLDWTYAHPDFPDALAVLDGTVMHYFDVRGVVRVFSMTVDDAGWTTARRDDDFWQRSRARFDGPDAMSGVGENSHDQGRTWEHDYDIRWTRAS